MLDQQSELASCSYSVLQCVPHGIEVFGVRDSWARYQIREHRVLRAEGSPGLRAGASTSLEQHRPYGPCPDKPISPETMAVAGRAPFPAQGSLLYVQELSSEDISVVKKMIALTFTPVIWLKTHHKTGFPGEPGTESAQAALGCVFKRPRQDSAASKGWKWKCLFASVCLPRRWRNPFIRLIYTVASEGLLSNIF